MMKQLKKMLIGTMIMPCWAIFLFAQAPDTLWTMTYGSAGDDRGYAVEQTMDGGYIIAGVTDTSLLDSDSGDVYLIKTDVNGNKIWSKTYGGTGLDRGYSVQQTYDGGYIITGLVTDLGSGDVYLVKTDADGIKLWAYSYGDTGADKGYSVRQTSDHGYIIVGVGIIGDSSQVFLIRSDSLGNAIWTKRYGTTGWDEGHCVRETSDHGFIVVGGAENQVYLLKTDANGNKLWTKLHGDGNAKGYAIEQTTDGGYIIAGYRASHSGDSSSNILLLKTDSVGDHVWHMTYGGENDDCGYSVEQTSDGGYIIAGYTSSFGNNNQVYLIKTDSLGAKQWSQLYGGANDDWGYSLDQTNDGGYIIAGYTASFGNGGNDVYLLKIGSSLGTAANNGAARPVITGPVSNPISGQAIFDLTLAEDASIDLRIYDVLGRLVDQPFNGRKPAGFHKLLWVPKVNSGVYLYLFKIADQVKCGRLIIID